MKHVTPDDFANAEAISSRKPKPEHYLAPTIRLELLIAVVALDANLTPAARRVLTLIVAHYNHHTGVAFPGEDRLAELLDLARPVVSAAIKLLVAQGWLKVERTRNGNRNGGNRYRLVLDKAGPMLDAAGLNVTKTERSEAVSVTFPEAESHVSEGLNVTFSSVSTSSKPDHNPATEPRKRTQQSEPDGARARELPSSSEGKGDRPRPQAAKVPFPADFRFTPEAEAAARARGLTDADMAKAVEGFRGLVGAEHRTHAHLDKAGAGYLAKREVRPDPDEMVRIPTGPLMSDRRCKRSDVKPWEPFIDSKGFRHPARMKPAGEGCPIM